MKKALFIVVLASVLVFAFSGVAMAKYAGYAYDGGGADVGYLSWAGANLASDFYSGGTEDTSTPHGGYTANTVKCAVCHSVHRAFAAVDTYRNIAVEATEPGVVGQTPTGPTHLKLTAGSTCTSCHTPSGATPVNKLVEWPSAYTDGGPHQRQNCVGACHAGVHGASLSDYAVAGSFMLDPALDIKMASDIAAGNLGGGVTAATLNTPFEGLTPAQQQGNRAMVTGYLCSQAGCHTSSQFAVNTWGFGGAVASDPGDTDNLDKIVTGHRTSMTRTSTCSGATCHSIAPGDWADGTGVVAGFAGFTGRDSICATCHDMVGVATGTTAWPHANRNIAVFEWERPEGGGMLTQTQRTITSGNLWMYAGDATYRDASGEPTATLMWDGYVPTADVVGGLADNRVNTRKVVEGAAAFNLTANVPGNIKDGVCLKCHGYKHYFHTQVDRNFSNY